MNFKYRLAWHEYECWRRTTRRFTCMWDDVYVLQSVDWVDDETKILTCATCRCRPLATTDVSLCNDNVGLLGNVKQRRFSNCNQAWAHTIIGIIWHIFEIRWLCHMKWDTSLKFKKYILWNVIHLWNTKSFSNEMWYTFEIQILCHVKCDTLLKFKLLVG